MLSPEVSLQNTLRVALKTILINVFYILRLLPFLSTPSPITKLFIAMANLWRGAFIHNGKTVLSSTGPLHQTDSRLCFRALSCQRAR